MDVEILNRAWYMGRDIKVRYRNFNMDWVKVPKQRDEGMELYSTLPWDLEKYEYQISGNQ